MNDLPEGWCQVALEQVAEVKGGLAKSGTRHTSSAKRPVHYLRVANVQRGFLDLAEVKRIEATPEQIDTLMLQVGDVLFNEGGDRDKLGRGWIWNGELPECIHQNHVFRARVFPTLVDSKWLSHYGNSVAQSYFEREGKQTTNLASIGLNKLKALPVVLPPLAEQRRIVAKLEELFSELDAGVEALRRAQRRLARYRQSLLQAAVTGELTREWREGERHKVQLGKVNVVPSGWSVSSLGDLLSHIEAGKNFAAKGTPPAEGEVGILKISAVTWNVYDEDESKTVPSQDLVNPRLFVRPGDFLISRANTLELVGACVIAHQVTKRLMLSDKVLRLHFKDDALKPWVLAFLKSRPGRTELESRASGNQLSMRNISQAKLETIPVPLPPEPARHIILAELDRRLSAADALESTLQASLRRAEHMRQSILERAFRGELVPQDPNDAPAEALLERLRNKKPTEVPAPPHRGRPPKAYAEAAPSQSPRHRGRPRKEAKA